MKLSQIAQQLQSQLLFLSECNPVDKPSNATLLNLTSQTLFAVQEIEKELARLHKQYEVCESTQEKKSAPKILSDADIDNIFSYIGLSDLQELSYEFDKWNQLPSNFSFGATLQYPLRFLVKTGNASAIQSKREYWSRDPRTFFRDIVKTFYAIQRNFPQSDVYIALNNPESENKQLIWDRQIGRFTLIPYFPSKSSKT